MFKKMAIVTVFLLPAIVKAQIKDSVPVGLLQTVIISSHHNNADFYGHRYDGQARTERLLDYIPGIDLISRGGFGQEPVLRGMSDGQINITINGMRMFGACTDRMDPVTSYVEPNNMSALQVCTGPSFSNCGVAIGGGLNFDLRQAQISAEKKWSGAVGTGFETNAAARQFLGNLQYSSKRFALSFDGIYRKAGDYSPGGNKSVNIAKYGEWTPQNGFSVDDKGRINFSQYEKWNAHANASYKLNAHHTLFADYLQDRANNVGYPALTMDVASARSATASITHEYHNTDKALYYWQSRIYYSDIDHAMDNSKRPMEEMPMQMMMSMTGHSQTGGAFTQFYLQLSPAQVLKTKLETYLNRWHAGMTMMDMDSANNSMFSLTIPDAQRTDLGVYVADEIRLGDLWRLTPGIHSEYAASAALASLYSGKPDNNRLLYSADAALSYRPVSSVGFDLDLARAMRSPTLKEMYAMYLYNRVDGYDYIGNPGIKTESSFNTDLKLTYRKKDFEVAIEGFGYFFQHYIAGFVQAGDAAMTPGAIGVKQFGNIHSAYITGASLLLSWQCLPALVFNSNTTLQRGEDNNRNDLPLITPLKSVNTIRYTMGGWRFFAEGISAVAQNKTSPFYGETPVPGFFIANAGADKSINLRSGQLILSLTCNNMLNRYYTESLDVIKLPRAGRNLILHTSYNF